MAHAPFATRLHLSDGQVRYRRTAQSIAVPFIACQTWEKWMKLVKTSAMAFAVSALLAGPVLAQGASSDTQIRGAAPDRSNMQGGASGSGEEGMAQPSTPGAKTGTNAKAGSKSTVGSGGGAARGGAGAAGEPITGGKRY
jgi:hypothetical protein